MRGYERDRLAAFNERIKLMAGLFNALGLGLIGFAVLRPVTEIGFSVGWFSAAWGLLGLFMHGVAHYILGYIKKERSDALV